MGELPTGTITMLFSDVEGPTALPSRLGDRYGEALTAQRAILRAAFAEFGGHEMGAEGDSFFVVFGSAPDAVCGRVGDSGRWVAPQARAATGSVAM